MHIRKEIYNILLYGSITVCILFALVGLWWAFFNTPPDYQQEYSVLIMFIHVPAAWMSFWIFALSALLSLAYLFKKKQILTTLTKSIMLPGLFFTLICLITGSIWGKPSWGTWWVWDARITSMVVLLISYCSYFLLNRAWKNHEKKEIICAFFIALAAINLPIVKFSVEWWYTLHQPSGLFQEGKVDNIFRIPLVIFFMSFIFYFLFISLARFKILRRSMII